MSSSVPSKVVPKKVKPCKPKAKKSKGAKTPSLGTSGAPVNAGVRVTGKSTSSVTEAGTDLLGNFTIETKRVGVITQLVITPAYFPRLSRLSGAFQRIRYHRLRFEVVTGTSTSTGGLYVVGFVKDATDPISAANASSTLLASGGTATKYWQSVDCVVNNLPGLYYTSPSDAEPRWSSPGSFVIYSIAAPTQKVSLEVFAHWSVTLSQPSYEDPSQVNDGGFHTAKYDISTWAGKNYLQKRENTGEWSLVVPSDFDPPLSHSAYYRMLGFRYSSVQDDKGVLEGIFGFCRIKMGSADESGCYPVNDRNVVSDLAFHDSVWVIAQGEKVAREDPPENYLRAPWFSSPLPACSSYGRLLRQQGLSSQRSPLCIPQVSSRSSNPLSTASTTEGPTDSSGRILESSLLSSPQSPVSLTELSGFLRGLLDLATTYQSQASSTESQPS